MSTCVASAACLAPNPTFDGDATGPGATSGTSASAAPATTSGATETSASPPGSTSEGATAGATSEDATAGATSEDATAGTTGATVDEGATLCGFAPGAWTLSEPTPVAELNSPDGEGEPYLTPDGRTLYFASSRPGGLGSWDSYRASRETVDSPFGAPVNNEDLAVNLEGADTKLALSPDGTHGYLASARPGGPGGSELWSAARAEPTAPFGEFTLLANLVTAGDEYDPHISEDGLRLYFATGAPLGVVMSQRPDAGASFPAAAPVAGLEGPDKVSHPFLTPDERVIVFESDRPGGVGDSDLWLATRPELDAPFGPPTLLPAINSEHFEGEPVLRADGCELLFASTRPAGVGGWDLWRAEVVAAP
ncbi:MAG: PD40 domain-containing protein [Myxococcales bacterium]|nr:PD40 domain-containing protein [Myxococcales bacterium]